ncbi:ribonucleotide reductase of class Ia [Salmonella phage SD-1_S14]|nr:ribonucleotide reductase of class Ia [Salmonella phage SD-1_S14]
MINVTKRNGMKEPLSLDKIHQILFFAAEGLSGISVSEIEIRAQLQFYEGIETSTIHDILIKAAAELISEDTPNYQYVANINVTINLLMLQCVNGKENTFTKIALLRKFMKLHKWHI